jgi:hypothetical protein
MTTLYIANTVTDLVLGDINEHLPIQRLPLIGDVIGLGTTTSIDNGELSFIHDDQANRTQIYKGNPANGAAERQAPGSELVHFPYVCYTENATGQGIDVPLADIPSPLDTLQSAIETVLREHDIQADFCGIRLRVSWRSVIITVASKLCMWQQRRYRTTHQAPATGTVYDNLRHFKLGPQPSDNVRIHYLGPVSDWYLSGFYARQPETGLVTVPQAGQHLHLHGCSVDLRYAGHVHHDHPETQLATLHQLRLYPIDRVKTLKAELGVRTASIEAGQLLFQVHNTGQLDANDVDVAVVANDSFSGRQFFRLPWLAAGESQAIELDLQTLPLQPGQNILDIVVDPNHIILERATASKSHRLHYTVEFE